MKVVFVQKMLDSEMSFRSLIEDRRTARTSIVNNRVGTLRKQEWKEFDKRHSGVCHSENLLITENVGPDQAFVQDTRYVIGSVGNQFLLAS